MFDAVVFGDNVLKSPLCAAETGEIVRFVTDMVRPIGGKGSAKATFFSLINALFRKIAFHIACRPVVNKVNSLALERSDDLISDVFL